MPMAAKEPKRRKGHKVVFVEAPEELAARLKAVAERNRRSMSGETVISLEKHVKAEEARFRAEDEAAGIPPAEPPAKPGKRGAGK